MKHFKIVNLFLTRKCNLNCTYCGISKKPIKNIKHEEEWEDDKTINYFHRNEQSYDFWIDCITRINLYNPEAFFILYGAEPLLYPDLDKIINYLNENNINYTIISSLNNGIKKIIDKLFDSVEYVKGLSCSVDPGFWIISNNDSNIKSNDGYNNLLDLKRNGKIHDAVAEIVITKDNYQYLYETVERLSKDNIWSSISLMERSKNSNYDFSNLNLSNNEVLFTELEKQQISEIFDKLINSDFKIHMKEIVLKTIIDSFPDNFDCKIENNLHNITLDSDGHFRLCGRIKSLGELNYRDIFDLIDETGNLILNNYIDFKKIIQREKKNGCRGCSWTCAMMSKHGSENEIIWHEI
jgi:MoaA/NifB/PqqE/SkfB family radical SAM enzyme